MHHRLRRVAMGALATAGVVGAFAGPAQAADRTIELADGVTSSWSASGTGAYVLYSLFGCSGTSAADRCDATLLTVPPGSTATTLTVTLAGGEPTTDVDLYLYDDNNADSTPDGDYYDGGNTGNAANEAEDITIPVTPGNTYLVEVPFFHALNGTFTATATLN